MPCVGQLPTSSGEQNGHREADVLDMCTDSENTVSPFSVIIETENEKCTSFSLDY